MEASGAVTKKYIATIEQIERMSERFYFVLDKLTAPGALLPALFLTVINYFIYDLGDDAYFLAIPIAYV